MSAVTIENHDGQYLLASCWDWAQGRYHVTQENPWTSHVVDSMTALGNF
jgi:hypothetical protein